MSREFDAETLKAFDRIKEELKKPAAKRAPLAAIAREFNISRQTIYRKKDSGIVQGYLPLKARNY